jgi:hypothetical protein
VLEPQKNLVDAAECQQMVLHRPSGACACMSPLQCIFMGAMNKRQQS